MLKWPYHFQHDWPPSSTDVVLSVFDIALWIELLYCRFQGRNTNKNNGSIMIPVFLPRWHLVHFAKFGIHFSIHCAVRYREISQAILKYVINAIQRILKEKVKLYHELCWCRWPSIESAKTSASTVMKQVALTHWGKTKWTTFRRRHIQTYFLQRSLLPGSNKNISALVHAQFVNVINACSAAPGYWQKHVGYMFASHASLPLCQWPSARGRNSF